MPGLLIAERIPRLIAIVATLVVVVLVLTAVTATRRNSRALMGDYLDSITTSSVNGISQWYAAQHAYAARLSSRDGLRDKVLGLLADGSGDRGAMLADIGTFLGRDISGLLVVDQALKIVASTQPGWSLDALSAQTRAQLAAELTGSAEVTSPIVLGSGANQQLVILLAIPIPARSGVAVAGAVLVALDPAKEFNLLFAAQWHGGHGETLIADDEGLMQVTTRPFDELLKAGVVDPQMKRTVLRVPLVEPSQMSSESTRPRTSTPLGRALKAHESGRDLDGYLDYRGVKVVAAWRWVPALGLGVACKLDYDHVYGPQKTFERLCLGALVGAAALLGLGLLWMRRVSRDARQWRMADGAGDGPSSYTLGEKIGEGAMGEVYQASHVRLGRPVAIKIIRTKAMTQENIARFEREARLTCRLSHPNTVRIFDFGSMPDGSLFYVMEHLDGLSFQQLVKQHGPVPPARVIAILVQVLGALGEAHQLGLIHRDVKPSNLFICCTGGIPDVAKLLDFGLARDYSDTVQGAGLTRSGSIMGSPSCMPPELIERGVVDGRADLYSLGCVAYFLLTGQDVFKRDTVMATLNAHLNERPLLPSQILGYALPVDLEAVIMHALAKRPDDRQASAEAFRDSLLHCADAGRWTELQAMNWWAECTGNPPSAIFPATIPDPLAPTRRLPASPP